jgi:hypothetical protein
MARADNSECENQRPPGGNPGDEKQLPSSEEIFEIKVPKDATIEDTIQIIEGGHEGLQCEIAYQQGDALDDSDPVAECLTRTGNRALLTFDRDTIFTEEEGRLSVTKTKAMILKYEGKRTGVAESPKWKQDVEEQLAFDEVEWRVDKAGPEIWEEGEFEIRTTESGLDEEKKNEGYQKNPLPPKTTKLRYQDKILEVDGKPDWREAANTEFGLENTLWRTSQSSPETGENQWTEGCYEIEPLVCVKDQMGVTHEWRADLPDDQTIDPGDTFALIERGRAGASPKAARSPFSDRNYKRSCRRRQIRILVQTERARQETLRQGKGSEAAQATTHIFEEEEFVTEKFAEKQWDKSTRKSFFKWTRQISGVEGDQQRVIDQTTGKEPTELQGKTLILLAPDEDWDGCNVVLRSKRVKRSPRKGIRCSPIRVKIVSRCGKDKLKPGSSPFMGRITRMLKKSDARS